MKAAKEGLQEIVYALPLSVLFECLGFKVHTINALSASTNVCFDYGKCLLYFTLFAHLLHLIFIFTVTP